ncbi:hypothetical protein BDV38DRAFT_240902 [Aspergillus pseudotamarii]|uniref:Uncharacterized protein n=1 Tax=Aspergillus pseudotamarii TaxID=132259 RepID=A0A5N6SZJ6_ASPPS|nr:uncharacterized protein BDV38DRAFT_240902 [Aspergillus pseudotamarii]KAE8140052.1 hypothetical protein BDV38DRAFT_240902 [Aspergillus pseudotamarii]
MPYSRAISIARAIPMCAATNPNPFCPSICATTGVIWFRAGWALASSTPCRIRSMYEGIRFMPWVSTPRRSACTRHLLIIVAFSSGTPFAVRTFVVKDSASPAAMCFFSCWGSILLWAFVFLNTMELIVVSFD